MFAFLIDCEHIDSICGKFRKDFPQMIGRDLPQADLARWLELALLDALHTVEVAHDATSTQVYLFHEAENKVFENFIPSSFASDLDGKAFQSTMGEFLLAACPSQPDLGEKETLLCETLQSLLRAAKASHIVVAADMLTYGKRIKQLLADFPDAHVTLLTLQPPSQSTFHTEQIGFSIMAALGIGSEEI